MFTAISLVAAHFLFDYPLQGDWLSKIKNPNVKLVPNETIWPLALLGHAWIHAWAVLFITNRYDFFVVEFITHAITDYAKCLGTITYNQDQAMHLMIKLMFVALLAVGV